MRWLLNRLREPSTWRGLVWLATVAGLSMRPDQAEAIVTAGMALAGLLGVFLADEPKTVAIPLPPIELQAHPESGNAGADSQPVRSADELRPAVPPVPRVGVRPPIERGLNDHFSGGWGDR